MSCMAGKIGKKDYLNLWIPVEFIVLFNDCATRIREKVGTLDKGDIGSAAILMFAQATPSEQLKAIGSVSPYLMEKIVDSISDEEMKQRAAVNHATAQVAAEAARREPKRKRRRNGGPNR